MNDDATPPPEPPAPARTAEPPRPPERAPEAEVERRPEARPSTVMTQPPAAPPDASPAGSRPPSAPRQPFAEPQAPPSPATPPAERPTPPSRPGDPQAGVDTREISLAALREAAEQAQRAQAAAPDVDHHVDLVGAEEQEAADLDTEAAGLEREHHREGTDGSSPPTGPGGIDPRIRDRRVAVTRAEGRRRLRILLAVVSVASFIGIAWLIVQSPLLAVRTIKVEGSAQETQMAVQQAAGVETGTALLFVDTGAVARRVEKLPWVAKATVDRELPNDLKITVIERSPVAWARRPVPAGSPEGTLGAIVLVDRFGRVLGDSLGAPAGLPELIGMVRVPAKGASIEPAAPAAAVALLPEALRAQTGSVIRRKGQAVLQLIQPPGGPEPAAGEVRLGNLEDIEAKGKAALAILDVLAINRERVDYIDVRVPGAPATGD